MYWDNEYLPKSMALNIQQLRQDNPDHQVYVLNRLTLKEVLPDFIFTSTQLSEQQKVKSFASNYYYATAVLRLTAARCYLKT